MAEAGYLSPKVVYVDGTHIKANANTKKQVKAEIPAASKRYAKELMDEVNADREAHGAWRSTREVPGRGNGRSGFGVQDAAYLQESIRGWPDVGHRLQTSPNHEGRTRMVEICVFNTEACLRFPTGAGLSSLP